MHANFLLNNGAEYAWGAAFAGVALWLWHYRGVSLRLPFAICLLYGVGFLVLTQNSQSHAMPLGLIAAILLYDELREQRPARGVGAAGVLLPVLLALPLLTTASLVASVAGYVRAAADDDAKLFVVKRTNLRGLAVPMADTSLLTAFGDAERQDFWTLLNKARETRPRHELLPGEYVDTLMEAVDLLSGLSAGGVVVFDQVNPLPFVLGVDPPRGGNLWTDGTGPDLPAETVLRDADLILVPKFSTWAQGTRNSFARYAPYLGGHYQLALESRAWFLFNRTSARGASLQSREEMEL